MSATADPAGPPAAAAMRLSAAVAFALASLIPASRAEDTFVPEDVLGIVSYNVGDLTDDGRFIAATSSVRKETFGQDFRRDGDPTYVRAPLNRVLLIDTKTGQQTPIFAEKKGVRGMRWSPDGSRLAMLVFNGDVFEPVVWTKATNKAATLKVPVGKYVAENSDIRWTPDGKGPRVHHAHPGVAEARARNVRGDDRCDARLRAVQQRSVPRVGRNPSRGQRA
jgi:acylaminoacyl-peptidase